MVCQLVANNRQNTLEGTAFRGHNILSAYQLAEFLFNLEFGTQFTLMFIKYFNQVLKLYNTFSMTGVCIKKLLTVKYYNSCLVTFMAIIVYQYLLNNTIINKNGLPSA